jgi:hypothetical protein
MSRADDHFELYEWLGSRSENFKKIMIVEFNSGGTNFIPVRQSTTRQSDSTPADSTSASEDSSATFSSQSLQASLKASSDPRVDKLAQATALVNNPSYPSDPDLNRLAGFLASRL